jgi:hypothetical protein
MTWADVRQLTSSAEQESAIAIVLPSSSQYCGCISNKIISLLVHQPPHRPGLAWGLLLTS